MVADRGLFLMVKKITGSSSGSGGAGDQGQAGCSDAYVFFVVMIVRHYGEVVEVCRVIRQAWA
jgi:hypothetical protein